MHTIGIWTVAPNSFNIQPYKTHYDNSFCHIKWNALWKILVKFYLHWNVNQGNSKKNQCVLRIVNNLFMSTHGKTAYKNIHKSQENGVHEALLCVLLVLEIFCSIKNLTCALTLWARWFFMCWLCLICVSFEFILGLRVFTLSLRYHRAHDEFKMVSNQHIVNTKKDRGHTLAPIFWGVTYRQVSNIRRTKSKHLKDSRTVLRLSLPNRLKQDVKSRMKM